MHADSHCVVFPANGLW